MADYLLWIYSYRGEIDGSIDTNVYRKPIHTDRYLPFDSHHPMGTKKAVFGLWQGGWHMSHAKTIGKKN